MKTSRYFVTALLAVLALAAVTTTVSATPPSGQTPSGLVVGHLTEFGQRQHRSHQVPVPARH